MLDANNSYNSNPQSTPLLEETIGETLQRVAAAFPDQPALVVRHQDIRWTYREFLQEVDKLALGMLAMGIKPGDRVGIWAPNCVEWCLTQFATARMGAIMVCINPAYRLFELEYALNKVQCRAIITAAQFKSSDYLGMLRELAPELDTLAPGEKLQSARLPHLEMVVRMGAEWTTGMSNFDALLAQGSRQDPEALQAVAATLKAGDAINIQFTSGTTGSPKGATLSHRNILNNAAFAGVSMHLTPQDKLCIPVPLYHCFGMVLGTLVCMAHGATAVFPGESFEPLTTLETVQVFGIPHEKYGEQVCAWIKLQDGSSLNEESLRDFCRDQITHFKMPSVIRFVEEFPMTVTGKAQKFIMREQMAAELEQQAG